MKDNIQGQLELFKQYPLRMPCERHCDCEWCSFLCFLRRGYIWDRSQHDWCRNEKGEALRTNTRFCDWECHEWTPEQLAEFDRQMDEA